MKLRRVKSNSADAALIMQYTQHESPALWASASEEVQELQQAHGWLNGSIIERPRLLNRQQAHAHRARPSVFVIKQMNLQQRQLQQRIEVCETPGDPGKKVFCRTVCMSACRRLLQ